MKYDELTEHWKKEAEKMELNFVTQSLEEMQAVESAEAIAELVTEQLEANSYVIVKENNTEVLVREVTE